MQVRYFNPTLLPTLPIANEQAVGTVHACPGGSDEKILIRDAKDANILAGKAIDIVVHGIVRLFFNEYRHDGKHSQQYLSKRS
jgi:hypothetical protein